MNLSLKSVFTLLLVVSSVALAQGQTVIYDFQDLIDPFGHFGTITADSGLIGDCGSIGNVCATHTGGFTESPTSPNDIGMIEIGPLPAPGGSIDLSAFIGYSIDARFIRDTDGMGGAGAEVFTGLSRIKFGLQHDVNDSCPGSMDACSDKFDTPVELTETFQTYTVMFADLGLPGTSPSNLQAVQFKMLMLTGDFNSAVAPNRKLDSGDFNASSSVGGEDFLTWQRNFGEFTGTTFPRFDHGNANIGSVGVNTIIDGADLAIWESQFGVPGSPIADWSNGVGRLEIDNIVGILPPALAGVGAVPEPSGCFLILCCGTLLAWNTRRRV